MIDLINIDLFGDMLKLGGLGFVLGVAQPWIFRIVGGVVDSAREITG